MSYSAQVKQFSNHQTEQVIVATNIVPLQFLQSFSLIPFVAMYNLYIFIRFFF